jgi:hypothetical protein
MTLWQKLCATAHTMWVQATCHHGPWLRDVYSVLPRNVPSAHCKRCWKTVPQASVLCRDETRAEYIARAAPCAPPGADVGGWYDDNIHARNGDTQRRP